VTAPFGAFGQTQGRPPSRRSALLPAPERPGSYRSDDFFPLVDEAIYTRPALNPAESGLPTIRELIPAIRSKNVAFLGQVT
jgi:hypothetical protein